MNDHRCSRTRAELHMVYAGETGLLYCMPTVLQGGLFDVCVLCPSRRTLRRSGAGRGATCQRLYTAWASISRC